MTAKLSHSSIIDALEELSRNDLISIHNDYCQANSYYDEFIYQNCEYELGVYLGFTQDYLEAFKAGYDAYKSGYRLVDDYFHDDRLGSMESCNRPEDDWIDTDDIAEWLERNFTNEEIAQKLDIDLEEE